MEIIDKLDVFFIKRNGECSEKAECVLEEHRLDVYVNEHLAMKIVCTPTCLQELVVGRLLTEGYIDSKKQIIKCYICPDGYRAKVFLNKKLDDDFIKKDLMVPTCCTDNIGIEIKEKYIVEEKIKPYKWKEEWAFQMADYFAKDTKLHKCTVGVHSCILAQEGNILISNEDMGRHNAIDKAIGWALVNDIDLKKCMLYTSGRVPTDMVRKVIKARVPVFISKGVPTVQAVNMAKNSGMTLIGAARPDCMKYFSGSRGLT